MPGARSDAKRMWFGSTEPGVVQIRLVGPDADRLAGAAAELENAFHQVPGTVGIKQDWENKTLKLIIDVDQVRARRAGVSSQAIAQALGATFAGIQVSEYREGDKILPIVLRGEIEDQEEANENLFGLLPIAFAGIVILLIGQFNSIRNGGIILLTIPLILFGGALFYGMASVIAFGLVIATILTLGFVPVVYTLFFRIPTRGKSQLPAMAPAGAEAT